MRSGSVKISRPSQDDEIDSYLEGILMSDITKASKQEHKPKTFIKPASKQTVAHALKPKGNKCTEESYETSEVEYKLPRY